MQKKVILENGSILEFTNKVGEKYGDRYINLIIDEEKAIIKITR